MIPQIQFTPQGMVPPTRESVQSALWQMMRDAFGQSLNPDDRTPQGQLVTSLTAAIVNQNDSMVELGNNFDPRYAVGQFQEALGAVYFLNRRGETNSLTRLEFMGISGRVVPVGFIVIDEAGHEWGTTGSAVIGAGGTALADAKCLTPGPISAAAGTINQFKETIDGLDRVENPNAAVMGHAEESRVDFELRRYESVAANSKNMNNSVFGAVANIPCVIDAFAIDNPTDNTVTIGETNYPMVRNSLLVSVVGGNDQDIAKQILIKGGTGCSFMGNTVVTYLDEDSGNAFPPEYEITFLRPNHVTTQFRVSVSDIASVSFVEQQTAKQSILDQLASGNNRARIGGIVIGSAFMCALSREILPIRIEVSTDGGVSWTDYKRYGVDEFPVSSMADISIVQI